MTPRPPVEEQKATAIAFAKKRAPRPILIGEVAMQLGWWATLKETEALLEEMIHDGTLRRPTKAEYKEYGVRFGYVLAV